MCLTDAVLAAEIGNGPGHAPHTIPTPNRQRQPHRSRPQQSIPQQPTTATHRDPHGPDRGSTPPGRPDEPEQPPPGTEPPRCPLPPNPPSRRAKAAPPPPACRNGPTTGPTTGADTAPPPPDHNDTASTDHQQNHTDTDSWQPPPEPHTETAPQHPCEPPPPPPPRSADATHPTNAEQPHPTHPKTPHHDAPASTRRVRARRCRHRSPQQELPCGAGCGTADGEDPRASDQLPPMPAPPREHGDRTKAA